MMVMMGAEEIRVRMRGDCGQRIGSGERSQGRPYKHMMEVEPRPDSSWKLRFSRENERLYLRG